MFLTNIFRKKLYKKNSLLGDDFERTEDIIKQGYSIVLYNDLNMPRKFSTYTYISFRDLIRIKVRTAMARKQIIESNEDKHIMKRYYYLTILFIIKKSFKKSMGLGFMMVFWILVNGFADFSVKMKKVNTRKGWKMRMKR